MVESFALMWVHLWKLLRYNIQLHVRYAYNIKSSDFLSLQYATGLSAIVIGKPSPSFFMSALSDLQVAPENVTCLLWGPGHSFEFSPPL